MNLKFTSGLIALFTLLLSSCGDSASGAAEKQAEVEIKACYSNYLSEGGNDSESLRSCMFLNKYYRNISEADMVECYVYGQFLSVGNHYERGGSGFDEEAVYAAIEKAEFETELWQSILESRFGSLHDTLYHSQSFYDKLVVGLGGEAGDSLGSLDPEKTAPKVHKKNKKCVRMSNPVYNVLGKGNGQ